MLRGTKSRKKQGIFSNHCGLGGEGPSQHPTDDACIIHDAAYDEYSKKGLNPYLSHSPADDEFRTALGKRRREGIPTIREKAVNYGSTVFAKSKRLFPNIRMPTTIDDDQNMEGNDGNQVALMAAAPGAVTPAGSRETPIMYAQPSIGFQDTHTTIIPYRIYLGFYKDHRSLPIDFRFSLVAPGGTVVSAISNVAESATTAYSTIANRMIGNASDVAYSANIHKFPRQGVSNAPGWWSWWTKMYDSYTVLGSQYTVTMKNVGYCGSSDVMLGYHIETSTTDDDTNTAPDNVNYTDAKEWKHLSWQFIPGTGTYQTNSDYDVEEYKPAVSVLSGTYRPGQANRLVQNDQDTETWHRTINPPKLRENMHMMFYSSPLSTNSDIRINMELEVKFIVQFKDLKKQLRFPQGADTALSFVAPTDIVQPWV